MLEFAKSDPYTLGVEVELQVVDKQSMELTPKAPELINRWSGPPRENKWRASRHGMEASLSV
jgi:gamma-glutamyl:cysteine ligase YbdK (ATP-grasp superfamily)